MEKLGAERGGIVAAIGPLIRQHSYEVGGEFVERFLDADAGQRRCSSFPGERDGHSMFDLAGFIRMRLENAGVLMIDDVGVDTYSDERFFSYRRSVHRKEPDYGRACARDRAGTLIARRKCFELNGNVPRPTLDLTGSVLCGVHCPRP